MPKLISAAFVFAGLMSTGALAQSPDEPLKKRGADPNMPAPSDTIPEKAGPGASTVTDEKGRSLSEKLNTSDGVLRPKGDPDPGITAKPPEPNPNSTPVIKPPGSPGGDPSIKPK
jgi:hypothetical protein